MNWRATTGLSSAVLAVCLATGAVSHASAQQAAAPAAPRDPVTADVKGAVGLGLIGAELGFVLPAAAGMDQTWAYLVFPLIGAAGGAAGGYFLIEKGGHAEIAVATLTAGMVLVIPTMVLTLSALAYDPDEEAERQAAAGHGMLRIDQGHVALATPAVAVTPGSRSAGTASEVRVALLSGRF